MPRPQNNRRIGYLPTCRFFKPQGIPLSVLEKVILADDELEAVRLADVEQLYQEQAAEMMGISRQTFGRIIESAHKKIGDALVNGKALCIEGGAVTHGPETPAAADELCPCGKRRHRHGSHCDHQ